jgi:hypothetical protein
MGTTQAVRRVAAANNGVQRNNSCSVSATSGTLNIMRRWLPWSIIAIVVTVVCTLPFAQVKMWVGRKTLDVDVLVIDTDDVQPLPSAGVTIFDGPSSPIEPSVKAYKPAAFVPDPESPRTKTYTTDSEGRCRFKFAFHAAGSSGTFRDSGYVDTSQAWIRVSAPARGATLVPLDRQSGRPRDLHDETPVFVTVVLNKCAAQ